MKKFISSFMACVAMCTLILAPVSSTYVPCSSDTITIVQTLDANAASVRKCFTINTSNTPVYSNTNLSANSKIGSIYPTDEIVVNDVTSKYTKVTYPISGGRTKTGYIATSAILTGTTGNTYTSKGTFPTYKRNTTDSKLKYGSVAKNDKCIVLGTKGGMVQIKYPVSGGFKYAFCTASDAKNYLGYGTSSTNSAPKWDSISNGTYTIIPKCAQNSCIDVSGAATSNGTKIHQWSKGNNQSNQLWDVTRNSDGSFSFYAKHCNKAADLNGNNIWNCNKISLWERNNSNAQKFWLKSEGNGWYSIRCFNNTNYVWDINGNVSTNGAQLQCYQYNKSNAQLFKFVAYSAPKPVNNNQPVNTSKTPTVYKQNGQNWSSYKYGWYYENGKKVTGTIGHSGCGLLSLTNAVYYLNGNFIEPTVIAKYSLDNGYRVNNVGTSCGLYKSFCSNRGGSYGIKYVNTVSSYSDLRNYLNKGNVAIIHATGHIMACVSYSNGKYLVLDSYPSKNRGTSNGYAWKTEQEMNKLLASKEFHIIGKK